MTRRGRISRRLGCALLAVVAILMFVIVVVLGMAFVPGALVELAFGWIPYTVQLWSSVRINWWKAAIAVALLAAVAAGSHVWITRIAAALSPPRRWRARDTAASLGLFLALLLAGMTLGGIGHQIGWLASTEQPLTRSSWDTLEVAGRFLCSNLRSHAQGKGSFPLGDVPAGHELFHLVPLDVSHRRATAVLMFARDRETFERQGGLLCSATGTDSRLSPPEVAARLAPSAK